MTPEGQIKSLINAVLNKHSAWYFMPVPTGLQTKTVDYLCCCKGHFIAIEAKAPGKRPTARQEYVLRQIQEAGGLALVIDSRAMVAVLDKKLGELE